MAHIHKNKGPVSDEEKGGIESGKGGNCFKVFCVIETEGIIVSDVFGNFPAEEKGNETGNGAKPKENLPGPIAIGNFRIKRSETCAIGGNKPAENGQTENSGADYNGFQPGREIFLGHKINPFIFYFDKNLFYVYLHFFDGAKKRRFSVWIICSDNYYIPPKFSKVNKNLSKNDKLFSI